MFSHSHRYHYDIGIQAPTPQMWSAQVYPQVPQELSNRDVSEISGNQVLEMPAEFSNLTRFEQPSAHGDLRDQGTSAPMIDRQHSSRHRDPQRDPPLIDTFTNNQRPCPPQAQHEFTSPQTISPSAWGLSPQEYSPSEGQSGHPYPPPSATAGVVSHSRPAPAAATTDITTFTSLSHSSYHEGHGESNASRAEAWDNGVDRYDPFSQSLPTYLASPPYDELKVRHEGEYSISPVSSHQESYPASYSGASTLPLTPPMASPAGMSVSFSPTEQLRNNFHEDASSPSSQVYAQRHPMDVAPPTTFDSRIDVISPIHGAARRSQWERQIPQSQRSYQHESLALHAGNNDMNPADSYDKTFPSAQDTPAQWPGVDHDVSHTVGTAYTSATTETNSPRLGLGSFVGKLLKPLACGHCRVEFNGEYQKGNRERHIRSFHRRVATVFRCRSCTLVYKRDDARKKHEWKKHDAEDCRPEKRRPEKRSGDEQRVRKRKVVEVEKRIYMPNSVNSMHELP